MAPDEKGEGLIIDGRYRLSDAQSYPKVGYKDSIVLHHTAGTTARGALNWWNETPEKVGVAFVIDRDGKIYQAFDTMRWGYHLGVKGDSNYVEKHSVGIELVSAGILHKGPDDTFWFFPAYPKKFGGKQIPKEHVVEMKWRGGEYFHKYTDAQIKSLVALIQHLGKTLNIKTSVANKFWEFQKSAKTKDPKEGIWSHTSFREDKSDIFPQKSLIDALKVFGK